VSLGGKASFPKRVLHHLVAAYLGVLFDFVWLRATDFDVAKIDEISEIGLSSRRRLTVRSLFGFLARFLSFNMYGRKQARGLRRRRSTEVAIQITKSF